ncbi:carboxypeptidase regulatory-like domain-containing protein [Tenacibaculum amylolyticum]|uniref:carboxypeptidase regulatory-like domain-containing protein n=1 Tax=Tenacibaculum amylolyticum TaxID=104269 RepID=UPI003895C383
MKNKLKIFVLLFVLSHTFFQCGVDGGVDVITYGDLTGKVVKKENFEPIENVKVTLSPTNNTTFTNADGEFSFERIEVQEYSVRANKDGYLDTFEGANVSEENIVNVVLEMDISTALNQGPTQPNLLTPEDETTDLENTVTLTWESTDPDEDELLYTIEIRNNFNNEIIRVENITEESYELQDLKFGGKYFWQVIASDEINPEVASGINSFTIKEEPANRFFYVKSEGDNNVIYSSNFNFDTNEVENEIRITSTNVNSWRPRKNNAANLIAFLRIKNNEVHIHTMKTNGEDVRQVTSSVPVAGFNLNEIDFSWSTNGSRLIYPNFDKLYMINKDGTGLQEIFSTADGSLITECDWSEDESKIAIKTNNADGYNSSIYIIDLTGNILNTVISNNIGAVGGLNLSASGNQLLFSRDITDFQSDDYRQLDTRMFIYNFTDDSFRDISDDDKEAGTNDLDPRFSPNESRVIFVNTSNDGVSQRNIMELNLDGVNLDRRRLFSNAVMPDWE